MSGFVGIGMWIYISIAVLIVLFSAKYIINQLTKTKKLKDAQN